MNSWCMSAKATFTVMTGENDIYNWNASTDVEISTPTKIIIPQYGNFNETLYNVKVEYMTETGQEVSATA
jgi:hypothetical protein